MDRIILHIDVNNAFLSWSAVWMLKNGYNKDIRNRYAVIAGDESQRRGIVLAKSGLCKKRGVKTADPIYLARRKCPYLEVYPPKFGVYKKFSDMMYKYLCNYTNIIERYSIDECFLDYTGSINLFGDPVKVAYRIKDDIYKKFGFTVNVGVGNNKLLAKMASDFEKPNKVHTLFSNEIEKKMFPLPIEDLFMIGKASSKKLREMGITTIGELAKTDEDVLVKKFKQMGKMMHEYANGIDNSEVMYEREQVKSISNSTVLPYNYHDIEMIKNVIHSLSNEIGKKLRNNKLYADTVGIWFKYTYFDKVSRQIKLDNSISNDEDIYSNAFSIFNSIWNHEDGIRSICVFVSGLSSERKLQLSLFDDITRKDEDDNNLQDVIDDLRDKFGDNVIGFANKKNDKNTDSSNY
ncbi:MAG: DNA polymerase thumb domain-containing protein [Bacilli bacterium]